MGSFVSCAHGPAAPLVDVDFGGGGSVNSKQKSIDVNDRVI